MALIKQHTLINGAVGNYWRVNKIAVDEVTGNVTVVYALYTDEEQRQLHVDYPLDGNAVTFVFRNGDHPISEIQLTEPIIAAPQDIPAYLMYRHTRAVAEFAGTVEEANRTQNEHRAAWFSDALDG